MKSITEQIVLSIRRLVALQLWDLGAIKVNLDQPFKLASGNYSPIYVNCRRLISSPAFVDLLAAAARVICDAASVRFDVIAGGETAGIPFAAFLSRAFNRPMVYVRKQAKTHGIATAIEGVISAGERALLVEDLITDAGSKLGFIESLKQGGGVVEDVLVVFDRLQGGREVLQQNGIRLHAVTDMKMVLEVASDASVISAEAFSAVRDYLASPKAWHIQRNLQYFE